MTVLNKLAKSLNRRDEAPNIALALAIVRSSNRDAVRELVENLAGSNKNVQSDCIKVLYEIGERNPKLIARHCPEFGKLLDSRNNRLVWGAMTALDAIALEEPKGVFRLLAKILECADAGSVITRDHAVGVLIKLASSKSYSGACLPLLLEQLRTCPNNQLPMYAEKALPVIAGKNRRAFQQLISSRLRRLAKPSQQKRLQNVLKQLRVD